MQNPDIAWQAGTFHQPNGGIMQETAMGGLVRLLTELGESTLFRPYRG